jgi:hypothetical protein
MEILTYQRYSSHLNPVRGSMEVPGHGKLILIWDNKYSKMRSKQLTYVVKVRTKSFLIYVET